MKLLFASSEIYPYAKTGGLADVSQALPKALYQKIDTYSIMPLYGFIDRQKHKIYPLNRSFYINLGADRYSISLYQGFNKGVKSIFVYEDRLCDREYPYGDELKGDYDDNDIRFAIFCRSIVEVAKMYEIDILHLNDWHTALSALYARELYLNIRIIFTIHNLAFQGVYPKSTMDRLGLDPRYLHQDSLEFWGDINLLKAGITYSDIITTVSPKYAQEMLTPEFGCGIDGFLKLHKEKIVGILNGIDTFLFDPLSDSTIPQKYSRYSFYKKRENKRAYCRELGFDESLPLFIFVGRFTKQKGLDIIIQTLPKILDLGLNIAILGEGDMDMALKLIDMETEHDNLSIVFGYDESLSHQMYAAADFMLMPSSFEPCGLNQLISLRYGTIPIVHPVGGLYDTISDIEDIDSQICGRGIEIAKLDSDGLVEAIKRALDIYQSYDILEEIAVSNMACDVSFEDSSQIYLMNYMES